MSYAVGKEISSIKPDTPQKSKRKAKFSYDTSEYDSYAKMGFNPPDEFNRADRWEQRLLNAADVSKSKIKVTIKTMHRIKYVDYSTEKELKREWLYYNCEWKAKNWLGVELKCNHIAGKYYEQTQELQLGDFDPKTGEQKSSYVKGVPRLVYSIPFSKQAVDKILKSEHPFGEDSLNITDPDKILYYGHFDNTIDSAAFRCAGFTYDQFVTPEWKRFLELATRKGGPQGTGQPNQKEKDKETFIA